MNRNSRYFPRATYLDGSSRAAKITARLVFSLLGLSLLAGHAGGLGIAPLMAIAGVAGLVLMATGRVPSSRPPTWALALFTFMLWAVLSAGWSPYPATGLSNPIKIIIGAALFLMGITAFKQTADAAPASAATVLIALVFIALVFLFIDTVSGYGLSFFVDPIAVGQTLNDRMRDAEMNVGHGITVLNLLLPTTLVLLIWSRKKGPMWCVLFLSLFLAGAVFGGLMVGVLAIGCSLVAMALAYRYGPHVITGLGGVAVMLVGFAPFWGTVLGAMPQSLRGALPFSWEHRVVTWDFTAQETRAAPIIGHGFDAVRVYQDKFSARGFDDLPVMPLHPHNAGLHIWVETGLIGALLAVIAIVCITRAATRFARGGRARAITSAGVMAAVIVISSVSYGVWQDWWWASVILACALCHWVPQTKAHSPERNLG